MLTFTSCQARNTFPLLRALPAYLGRFLDLPLAVEQAAPWQERSRRLAAGDIQVGWICARPYALQLDAAPRPFAGLAAPVTQGARYAGQPVYFSYLVVHRAHPAAGLRELENGRVAFNEPGSQSGTFSLLMALAAIGAPRSFFAEWVESGAHRRSLEMLQQRRVDAAAIDSTLWEYEAALAPARVADLKIIDVLGPYPAPPLVAHVSVPAELRARLAQLLAQMHQDAAGRAILRSSRLLRFVPVIDAAYRPLAAFTPP